MGAAGRGRWQRRVDDARGRLCGVWSVRCMWGGAEVRMTRLTSITPNRTREMRINRARKAIVSKRVSGHTPRAEILGR